jgi:hypothetical protein
MRQIARVDTWEIRRAVARHSSGDTYVVEYASVFDGDGRCAGATIARAVGPLNDRVDLYMEAGELTPATYDAIGRAVNLTGEDAAWLNAEEDAGRLTYPIGAW